MYLYVHTTECFIVLFVVGFGVECLQFICCSTYKILHTGDTESLDLCNSSKDTQKKFD